MKIVILERDTVGSDVSVDALSELGDTTVYEGTRPELVAERVREADIVIANKMPLNASTLADAKNVKMICQFATGFDNIDTEYCKSRGIAVANVSDYCTASVVQHTLAMALYLCEHLPFYERFVNEGHYSSQAGFTYFEKPFTEFAGKTWGILGMGHIGRGVAKAVEALGCRVIWASASDTRRDEGYEQVSLSTLLSESDILSLHCPLNAKTKHIIDRDALHAMKNSALLINVARGPVVDNAALTEALKENEIAAAGLDVMEGEPLQKENPLCELLGDERLLITPHMAWASLEARQRVVYEACENIRAFMKGKERNRIV
ncbi:MAG: hydroxyacid dehydrogenase [Lachnospiraceae bacterium]|nr:hydroxyacid dehydrogenase [Lachnospiraceae bacterium]